MRKWRNEIGAEFLEFNLQRAPEFVGAIKNNLKHLILSFAAMPPVRWRLLLMFQFKKLCRHLEMFLSNNNFLIFISKILKFNFRRHLKICETKRIERGLWGIKSGRPKLQLCWFYPYHLNIFQMLFSISFLLFFLVFSLFYVQIAHIGSQRMNEFTWSFNCHLIIGCVWSMEWKIDPKRRLNNG